MSIVCDSYTCYLPNSSVLISDPAIWVRYVCRVTTFGKWRRIASELAGYSEEATGWNTIDAVDSTRTQHFFGCDPGLHAQGHAPFVYRYIMGRGIQRV